MKRWRWLLALLLVLLLAGGGVAGWGYAHRAYPAAVYDLRIEQAPRPAQTGIMAHVWLDCAHRYGRFQPAGEPTFIVARPDGAAAVMGGRATAIAARPYLAAVAAFCLRLAGTPAPRRLLMLPGGWMAVGRIAPRTLPADFFDPPHLQQSLWERLTGWLQDHLRR